MNSHQNFLDKLAWRYATKKFDPAKKLSADQIELIKESLRLSPSSFGIQPWKFYYIKNSDVRAKIREISGQPQMTDASDLFVCASRINLRAEDVAAYVKDIAATRDIPEAGLGKSKKMMTGFIEGKTSEWLDEWSARQVYIALGFGLMAAAQNDIDACPMEGFDVEKVDVLIGADKDGYSSRAMLAVGFRAADDAAASFKKVRFSEERTIKVI